MTQAFIHRIATAAPEHEVHGAFVAFAGKLLQDDRARSLFHRMAAKAEIERRYSVLQVVPPFAGDAVNANEFYQLNRFPGTEERMRVYERWAPRLLHKTLDRLHLTPEERSRIRHVIVTSCTGHYAPGLDFAIIDYLGLSRDVSRTMVGFMGCYAAINGLRQAQHIVRSAPDESVLLVNLELCTLHLQESQDLAEVLSFLIFGDGCAVSLISAEPGGLAMDAFRTVMVEGTRNLITWRIGDGGFLMHLSGQVPGEIEKWLRQAGGELANNDTSLWAIHPGGNSVLDAVERGLGLPAEALTASRQVLRSYGNMSSATVMFVLEELMRSAQAGEKGLAMSFGPGLTAETMEFHAV
ncbi:type III polyketide synthase [Terriglobus albidus]|uniref:type III polyketide synthase n=1 Tax=Terriglobus albidus TaxID=1592106 RepID=UPI0021DFADD4|nr:type III polyketide synthase [Terriglobus albidus]